MLPGKIFQEFTRPERGQELLFWLRHTDKRTHWASALGLLHRFDDGLRLRRDRLRSRTKGTARRTESLPPSNKLGPHDISSPAHLKPRCGLGS